jgi:hypothetical protein
MVLYGSRGHHTPASQGDPMTDQDAPSGTAAWIRSFGVAFAFGLLLASFGAAASFRAQRDVLETSMTHARAEVDSLRAAKNEAGVSEAAAKATTKLWQARVAVYRAGEAVEQRNFGLGEEQLKAASALLGEACPPESCPWLALQQRLAEHRFSVAGDGQLAVLEVRQLGAEVDGLLGP